MSVVTKLNMQPVIDIPGAVVSCRTAKEAKQFLEYMKTYHPERVSNWLGGRTEWEVYKERTVYYVYFDHHENSRKMLYGDSRYVSHDRVVEFCSLLPMPELDIELSGESLDFLLGV